jgi:glutathione S-transferase
MSAMEPITIGYWTIRGLAAPLRMMAMFKGVAFNSQNYDCVAKSDGSFDTSSWAVNAKPELKAKNPLMNLPYIIDGDKIISQSNACFMHLGRKFNMLGKDEIEMSCCEQLLCELMDLRNRVIDVVYRTNDIDAINSFLNGIKVILGKMELWLDMNKNGQFLVGSGVTAPDFHFFELLDQIYCICNHKSLENTTKEYSKITAFYKEFIELSENSKYLSSKLHSLPMNNKMAKIGANPDGSEWKIGQSYDFATVGGIF